MMLAIKATISAPLNTAMICWSFWGRRSTRMDIFTAERLRIAWLEAKKENHANSSSTRSSDHVHEMSK